MTRGRSPAAAGQSTTVDAGYGALRCRRLVCVTQERMRAGVRHWRPLARTPRSVLGEHTPLAAQAVPGVACRPAFAGQDIRPAGAIARLVSLVAAVGRIARSSSSSIRVT